MMSDRPAPLHIIALAAALAACSDGLAGNANDIDSIGVLATSEDLRIGSVDDPDYGFSSVYGIDVDRNGLIYAYEGTDNEIRVYSPDGKLVRRIGREGAGPGEFRTAPQIGILGDTLWAIELSARRITLFRLDGTVISAAPIQGVTVQVPRMLGLVMPSAMRPDGSFTSDMQMYTSPQGVEIRVGDNDTIRVPRILFDSRGNPIDTIGWMPRLPDPRSGLDRVTIGGNRYTAPLRPRYDPLSTTLTDGRIVIDRPVAASAAPAGLRVTRLSLQEDTIYTRLLTYQPKRFSDAVLDTAAWRSARLPGGGYRIVNGVPQMPKVPDDSMTVFNTLRSAMDFPEFQPAVQFAILGKDGTIWLQREDAGTSTRRWTILDIGNGEPIGQVDLPRGQYPAWPTRDAVIVIDRDELEIPWVVRYRLTPR